MSKGQFGARDLQKAPMETPDTRIRRQQQPAYQHIGRGPEGVGGAAARLSELYEERDRVTVTIARRELRAWLRGSDEGREVEGLVKRLIV